MLRNFSKRRDSPAVTISQLGRLGSSGDRSADCEDVIAMLVEASTDVALCAATYLPPFMSAAQARDYRASSDGFVMREDNVPVGLVVIHQVPRPGDGVQLPAGCVEIEQWVLPRFRQRGLWRRAWPAICATLAVRFMHLVAVCWEDNHAGEKSLRACGFQHLGRSFWDLDGDSGWCAVFVYDLRDPHTQQSVSDACGQRPPG